MSGSQEIEAPGPNGPLSGTLLGPPDPGAPVVLIVPGSGPTNRDGNSPLGIRASTYRLIAEGLAARRIRSVRVDKRGLFGSARAVPDANATTMQDYAADIRTWAATIRQETGAPCVWVLGHSEGGLAALLAAQQPTGLCGLLLVSTAGRSFGAVLRGQIEANPAGAPLRERAEAILMELEASRRVTSEDIPPPLQPLFRPEVQSFLSSVLALDPAKLAAAYPGPVLILQGLCDIQVGRVDAERLHGAHPNAEMVLLPEANHVLKAIATDDRAANIATYVDPDQPLADGVIDALASFVRRQGKDR